MVGARSARGDSMRCGEWVARLLVDAGVTVVFGIPGVHTLEYYCGFAAEPRLRLVLARHEQGAALMADGYARATGRPGDRATGRRLRHYRPRRHQRGLCNWAGLLRLRRNCHAGQRQPALQPRPGMG